MRLEHICIVISEVDLDSTEDTWNIFAGYYMLFPALTIMFIPE
jgi:hypothetical protein